MPACQAAVQVHLPSQLPSSIQVSRILVLASLRASVSSRVSSPSESMRMQAIGRTLASTRCRIRILGRGGGGGRVPCWHWWQQQRNHAAVRPGREAHPGERATRTDWTARAARPTLAVIHCHHHADTGSAADTSSACCRARLEAKQAAIAPQRDPGATPHCVCAGRAVPSRTSFLSRTILKGGPA
jgi:hypothetical protein